MSASGAPAALEHAAAAAFVLMMVALPTGIAPMGITTALCVALTLALWIQRRGGWVSTPVDRAALGWMAARIVVALCALDRAASLARLGKGLMPALVGFAAYHATRRERGTRAIAVLLAVSAGVALFGVAAWVREGASFGARARGLSGHWMTFGGQLLLEMSLAAGIALAARDRRWRLGALAVFAVCLVALGVTFTRSAWIGLVVALAVMLGLTRARWLAALAAAVAAAVWLAPGAWHARLVSVFDPANPWNQQRVLMWQAGLHMFRDHPLTGLGLQDLMTAYDRYRLPLATERVGHLHNVWVQIAASMGVVGLAAFVWLYAALVRTAGRGLRAQLRGGGLAAGVRLGVVAGLIGFLAAGTFEWNFGDEELLYPLFTLVGIAWAARGWDER